jgi:hypothetical protein
LKWLENAIPDGFHRFLEKRAALRPDLIGSFKFEALPTDFKWDPKAPDKATLEEALKCQTAVYG